MLAVIALKCQLLAEAVWQRVHGYHSTTRVEIGKHEIGIESGCYCDDATLTPCEEAHGSGALTR